MMLSRRVLRSFALVLLTGCTSPPSASPPSATSAPPIAIGPIASTASPIVTAEGPRRERTCEERVRGLAIWMSRVAAEGEFEHDPYDKRRLVQSTRSPEWLDLGLRLRVTPTENPLRFAGDLFDIHAAPPTLRSTLVAKRQGPLPLPILIYADSATPWSRLVEITTLLERAGESEVQFVVAAVESKIPAPPRSAVANDLERFASGDGVFISDKIREAFEHPTVPPTLARCAPARQLMDQVARESQEHRHRSEKLAHELPASIRACTCDADIDAVMAEYWDRHRRYSGRPMAAIRLRLSSTGASLSAPATDSWRDTVAAVSRASRDGKPVHLSTR